MNNEFIENLKSSVKDFSPIVKSGKVVQIIGLTIESEGPPVDIGHLCYIENSYGEQVPSEVVGFKNNRVLLMPLGEMKGIGPGSKCTAATYEFRIPVGYSLLGRVLNGLGEPLDDLGPLEVKEFYPITSIPPHPLNRTRIIQPITMGIKTIDGLLTCGKGQRIGIFSGSGVGKSTLLGMISRNSSADINVIALIGERGREVRDFIEKDLGPEGLKRSVIIVATSDQPALIRLKGAFVATTIAEYFRTLGKNVILFMDSLTRFALAQREVGLTIGEPPVTRGFTPSVFAVLPKLLERAGNSDKGSITGLYTVLVDGDDLDEPISDSVRGLLDGHIVLSRLISNKNQYPAIDVNASISRLMNDIVEKDHYKAASTIKSLLAAYRDAEDLINIGAYSKGSNKLVDRSIECNEEIIEFLCQDTRESFTLDQTKELLFSIVGNENA